MACRNVSWRDTHRDWGLPVGALFQENPRLDASREDADWRLNAV